MSFCLFAIAIRVYMSLGTFDARYISPYIVCQLCVCLAVTVVVVQVGIIIDHRISLTLSTHRWVLFYIHFCIHRKSGCSIVNIIQTLDICF